MAGNAKQLANQAVSAHQANSSVRALVVVQVDSTGGIISGGVGGGSTQVSIKEILTSSGASVMDSTNNAIGVTIRAGSAAGTEYTDGDIDATVSGGAILFVNSSNTLRPVTLTQGLPVNVVAGSAAGSTTVNVSSLGGIVRTAPSDTNWASSAGFHFDSSGGLQIGGNITGSTTVNVSSLAGLVAVRPSDTNWASSAGFHFDSSGGLQIAGNVTGSTIITVSTGSVRVHQSSAGDLNVTVAGYVAPSTIVTVSTGSVRVHQSTAGDLLMTASQGGTWNIGTVTTVSSVAGIVRTTPMSTVWASSAGFHFDSSGALQITGTFSASTTVNVSSVGGVVSVHTLGNSTAADYLPVRIVDSSGTGFLTPSIDYTDGVAVSTLVAPGLAFNNSSANTMRLVGSSTPLPTHLRTSSGADIGDSTERAIRVNVVAGAVGGSTTVQVSSLGGNVTVSPFSSGATGFFAVRVSDGSTFLTASVQYTDGSTVSTLVGAAIAFHNSSNYTMRLAGSTSPLPVMLRTDSGFSVMDSTAGAIKVNIVAGAGSGGTALADQTTFSTNVTSVTPIGAIVVSGGSDVPAGEAGALRMSSARALWAELVDSSGGPVTDSTQRAIRVTSIDVGGSTQVAVSSIAGAVTVRSSAANALFTAYQSTAADLLVTASQGGTWNIGTVTTVSSVAGLVKNLIVDRDSSTQIAAVLNDTPASTVWGLAVRQVGAVAASTTVQVSSVGGAVITRSSAAEMLVTVYQSSAAALLATVSQGGTWNIGTVTTVSSVAGIVKNQIVDRDNSTQVAAVLNDTPASTVWALAVRQVGGTPGSTTVNVSSLAGNVTVTPFSSGATGFFAVRVSDGSTFLQPSIEYTNGSTVSTLVGPALVYNNSSNDTMRLVGVTQPLPVQLRTGTLSYQSTTQFITSTHSTALYALVSSGAVRVKVYAFHVTSTHTNPSTMVFMSSLGSDLWHVGFGSGSSGVTGANLAVTPPAFLFATAINEALNVRIEGGNSTAASTTLARVSFSYFTE